MKRVLLVSLLGLFVAAPAEAADYLNGDWVIITGTGEVQTSDPTGEVATALARQKNLKCLAFTEQGNWSFLFGGNGIIYSGGMPESLVAALPALWKSNSEFRCLAFRPQGGWVLLHDKNGFADNGIPADVRTCLAQAQKTGGTFRSMAFAPDGGWVLLLEKDFRNSSAECS